MDDEQSRKGSVPIVDVECDGFVVVCFILWLTTVVDENKLAELSVVVSTWPSIRRDEGMKSN